jgi:hypothetical protein
MFHSITRFSLSIAIAFVFTSSIGVHFSSAYPAYLIGRKTLPGCDWDQGNTCVVKVDLPGPPEQGAEFVGEVSIDYSTATQLGDSFYIASPSNANQYYSAYGMTIVSIWYKTDGTPCPIPQQ